MSKLDDTKDALLDAITHSATQLREQRTAGMVDAWGKAAASLGQAYMCLENQGGMWVHEEEPDDTSD